MLDDPLLAIFLAMAMFAAMISLLMTISDTQLFFVSMFFTLMLSLAVALSAFFGFKLDWEEKPSAPRLMAWVCVGLISVLGVSVLASALITAFEKLFSVWWVPMDIWAEAVVVRPRDVQVSITIKDIWVASFGVSSVLAYQLFTNFFLVATAEEYVKFVGIAALKRAFSTKFTDIMLGRTVIPFSEILAVLIVTGIWAEAHAIAAYSDPSLVAVAFMGGLVIYITARLAETVLAAILVHGLYNCTVILLSYSSSVMQWDIGSCLMVLIVVLFMVSMLAFGVRRRRKVEHRAKGVMQR